jgi:phosphoglucosamine mutase
MERQLFGTDGIRGVAGQYPLDEKTVYATGRALGAWATEHDDNPNVLIGIDTRESGPEIARRLAAGLAEEGAQPRFAGVITTPGVAYLTRVGDFAAGVMISASHNPYQDNGIKVFAHSGYKLPDSEEHALEQRIFALLDQGVGGAELPLEADPGLDARYLDYLLATLAGPLNPFRVVLDCGHGAASRLAPELFRRAGQRVTAIHNSPDGRNINLGCGALHVESLRDTVLREGADLGFAFDGDADRCIAIAASGRVVDGDAVLYVCARRFHGLGLLSRNGRPPAVVATVMSNLGLELALRDMGIQLIRTPVGDKYVLEEMLRRQVVLGGEQSGHVIFADYATTGDGMLTALRVLEIMSHTGASLDELVSGLTIYPQLLLNVRVRERRPLEGLPGVQEAIRQARDEFGDAGRVFVRFSGTEPLARVMVEGPAMEPVERHARRIVEAIRAEIGA